MSVFNYESSTWYFIVWLNVLMTLYKTAQWPDPLLSNYSHSYVGLMEFRQTIQYPLGQLMGHWVGINKAENLSCEDHTTTSNGNTLWMLSGLTRVIQSTFVLHVIDSLTKKSSQAYHQGILFFLTPSSNKSYWTKFNFSYFSLASSNLLYTMYFCATSA